MNNTFVKLGCDGNHCDCTRIIIFKKVELYEGKIAIMLDKAIDFLRTKSSNIKDDVIITGESKLLFDLGFTSYDLIEMCCQMEETFRIEISDENLAKIETVNDIVKYLEKS